MVYYYSSIDNMIKNKPCCKLYAFITNGYLIKNISQFDNLVFLRIYHINVCSTNSYIGNIDWERENNNILVHSLCVTNEYQKRGIGSYLLNKAETDGINNKKNIILYIHQNMRNYAYYTKRGYNINKINGIPIQWNRNHNYIQMIKLLI